MAKGTSGYLKRKEKTYKELNDAVNTSPEPKVGNPADAISREMERAQEVAHGITDRIRNIFED